MISQISARDLLLLAFADLSSYGIAARPAFDGNVFEAHEAVADTAAGFAQRDYVFWLRADDENVFDADDTLTSGLPLYLGDAELEPAVREVLSRAGFSCRCNAGEATVLVLPQIEF
jgi:hypothetical protein